MGSAETHTELTQKADGACPGNCEVATAKTILKADHRQWTLASHTTPSRFPGQPTVPSDEVVASMWITEYRICGESGSYRFIFTPKRSHANAPFLSEGWAVGTGQKWLPVIEVGWLRRSAEFASDARRYELTRMN
jgi:hypothetical protein